MVVGTIGGGVPAEVLVAAGVDVVPVIGEPGGSDGARGSVIEPMVGERTRSQLQRAARRHLCRCRAARVLARGRCSAAALLHAARAAAARARAAAPGGRTCSTSSTRDDSRRPAGGIETRVRELCALLGVGRGSRLPSAIRTCNARARRRRDADPAGGSRRVYVTGSAHTETALRARGRGRRRDVLSRAVRSGRTRRRPRRGDRATSGASAARARARVERRARAC